MADLFLPGIEVFGDPFNNSAWDQSYAEQLYAYYNSLAQGGGGDAPPAGFEAFAPPAPEVLPEVKVTPRPPAPSPAPVPGMGTAVLELLGRVVPIVGGLLYPLPTGTGRPGELNEPLPGDPSRPIPLPEVEVEATRPPKPPVDAPPTAMPADPWPFNLDPLEWYGDLPGQRPFVPFTGAEPRPGDAGDSDPGVLGDPLGYPAPAPAPPAARPGPSVDAPGVGTVAAPYFDPGSFLDPRFEPTPGARPGPVAGPGFIENPSYFADPLLSPFLDPFVPAPARPVPGIPGAPVQLLDPLAAPDQLLVDPTFASPPTRTDSCSCSDGKKKKPKKRKARTICYRGTYTETARSLRKVRREQVPC